MDYTYSNSRRERRTPSVESAAHLSHYCSLVNACLGTAMTVAVSLSHVEGNAVVI